MCDHPDIKVLATRLENANEWLKEVREAQKQHSAQLLELHKGVAGLKVRSSVWGAVSGLLASALAGAVAYLAK